MKTDGEKREPKRSEKKNCELNAGDRLNEKPNGSRQLKPDS
jgi:hypothetical protein